MQGVVDRIDLVLVLVVVRTGLVLAVGRTVLDRVAARIVLAQAADHIVPVQVVDRTALVLAAVHIVLVRVVDHTGFEAVDRSSTVEIVRVEEAHQEVRHMASRSEVESRIGLVRRADQADQVDRVGVDRNIPQMSHIDLDLVEIEIVVRSSAEEEHRIGLEEADRSRRRADRIHLLHLVEDLRLGRVTKRLGLLVLSNVSFEPSPPDSMLT